MMRCWQCLHFHLFVLLPASVAEELGGTGSTIIAHDNRHRGLRKDVSASSSPLEEIAPLVNSSIGDSDSNATTNNDSILSPQLEPSDSNASSTTTLEQFAPAANNSIDNSDSNETAINIDSIQPHLESKNINVPHVDRMYTYGAPSVTKVSSYNNNNRCIPGIRLYTEDVTITTCSWYNSMWCTAGVRQVTNVDFAAQINIESGYHHPKMDTLVLRLVDGKHVEYQLRYCHDGGDSNSIERNQWWPEAHLASDIIQNNHRLDAHYETRLVQLHPSVRGPSLEYISVARCIYRDSYGEVQNCLRNYNQETPSNVEGVVPLGWEPFAYMNHKTMAAGVLADNDQMYILKNDIEHGNSKERKCIISFQGSDSEMSGKIADFTNFLNSNNDDTTYCGRSGVHAGISNEMREITSDPQYATEIVPALETCHDITCVAHSLGGSLCNLFVMCANEGFENLEGTSDPQGWLDYNSLIWTKRQSQDLSVNLSE